MSCRQAIASRCVPGTLAAHSFPRSCGNESSSVGQPAIDAAACRQCSLRAPLPAGSTSMCVSTVRERPCMSLNRLPVLSARLCSSTATRTLTVSAAVCVSESSGGSRPSLSILSDMPDCVDTALKKRSRDSVTDLDALAGSSSGKSMAMQPASIRVLVAAALEAAHSASRSSPLRSPPPATAAPSIDAAAVAPSGPIMPARASRSVSSATSLV
mmetsp:Transcript_56669/g.168249  ORF Transcript_56669/g.168249 Transcript_56669/m.168249 type:complete len:213 (+) Transcript_56669:351-989(+)